MDTFANTVFILTSELFESENFNIINSKLVGKCFYSSG